MKTSINGISINFEIIGQTGSPIVLIHGFGLNHTIWSNLANKYLGNHRVILPDVRGHGESDATEGAYTMSLLAKDLCGILDYLGIIKAIICGHSMGGYICLAFAEMFSERLSGLGLITTRAKADSEENQARRYNTIDAVRVEGSVAVAENLAPLLSKDEKIVKDTFRLLAGTPARGLIGALKGMAERPDRSLLLKSITVPSLVVAGEDDQIIPIEEAKKMADDLKQGELLIVPDVGHMPMLESPDLLGQELLGLIHRAERHTT